MLTTMNPQIHLVDDEDAVRDALGFLLQANGFAVRCYANGREFLDALKETQGRSQVSLTPSGGATRSGGSGGAVSIEPLQGCVLLDVRMEPLSGLQVHDEMLVLGIPNPVLFLSGHGDIGMAVDALKKGAFDFIEKPCTDQALLERVGHALRVEAARHVRNAQEAVRHARLASLSEREREVMLRVAAGKLNKVIADELGVAIRTVEVHRARVYSKLGVRSSAEVATILAQGQ